MVARCLWMSRRTPPKSHLFFMMQAWAKDPMQGLYIVPIIFHSVPAGRTFKRSFKRGLFGLVTVSHNSWTVAPLLHAGLPQLLWRRKSVCQRPGHFAFPSNFPTEFPVIWEEIMPPDKSLQIFHLQTLQLYSVFHSLFVRVCFFLWKQIHSHFLRPPFTAWNGGMFAALLSAAPAASGRRCQIHGSLDTPGVLSPNLMHTIIQHILHWLYLADQIHHNLWQLPEASFGRSHRGNGACALVRFSPEAAGSGLPVNPENLGNEMVAFFFSWEGTGGKVVGPDAGGQQCQGRTRQTYPPGWWMLMVKVRNFLDWTVLRDVARATSLRNLKCSNWAKMIDTFLKSLTFFWLRWAAEATLTSLRFTHTS